MVTTKIKYRVKSQMFEKELWSKSELICGVDEVGRSCFAGPVVAAAAILRPNAKHKLLKDSKLLTADERLAAFKWLKKNSVYAVGIMHHRLIDTINIYQATICAMKRAVMQVFEQAQKTPSLILIDAMPVKFEHLDVPVYHFPKAEHKSASVAAASIIAKVTRDTIMERINTLVPGYGFDSNKGYGTKIHRDALEALGITFAHRHSFLQNRAHLLNLGQYEDDIDFEQDVTETQVNL